jgi:geranylgeranyl reductase family protein
LRSIRPEKLKKVRSVIIYTSKTKIGFMKKTEDIIIVGGGPAGAYCALELTKQGIYPTILDHSYPREKPCGGGISPQVIENFPFVEKFRSKGFSFGDFRLISCTNVKVITKGLRNGFSISRQYFDEEILKMATQNGARLVREKALRIQRKGNLWKIITTKRSLSTKILVGADGVNSIVRRKTVGSISKTNLGLTFGYRATGIEKEHAAIKFLAEIPGYIWVFPGKFNSNIGIGSPLKYGNLLKKLLDNFISSYCPQIQVISRYSAMLPSAKNPKFFELPCAGENWILIGDAAGHVDPISGEGILYALWGGKLAAQTIKLDDLKSYDRLWRKEYGRSLEERCRKKKAFYDPVESTISIMLGLADKTYFRTN